MSKVDVVLSSLGDFGDPDLSNSNAFRNDQRRRLDRCDDVDLLGNSHHYVIDAIICSTIRWYRHLAMPTPQFENGCSASFTPKLKNRPHNTHQLNRVVDSCTYGATTHTSAAAEVERNPNATRHFLRPFHLEHSHLCHSHVSRQIETSVRFHGSILASYGSLEACMSEVQVTGVRTLYFQEMQCCIPRSAIPLLYSRYQCCG